MPTLTGFVIASALAGISAAPARAAGFSPTGALRPPPSVELF